ncbi:MAG: 2Fe-2S iron-sulfur cluster binding domain-containing protein [Betaproteobacteria bacterium]|nr:2Fe-2S iron-sulfur cluster binding domain-containing protein [Betaproteobacteria bacterium]
MAHRLSLSRAAHLVGVHRSALQKMISEGTLATAEGMVTTEELLRAFPLAELEASGAVEWVTRIKEESFGRRVRERMLASQEILAQRLFAQGLELAELRRTVQRYHALVEDLERGLRESFMGHPAQPRTLAALADGLGRALAGEASDAVADIDEALRVMTPRVEVRPSGREFYVEGHDSLLQAGLKAGLRLSYGCENGTCGLCRARVVDGDVQRIRPHDFTLSEAERAQGHILMCAYSAVTDVKLETLEASGPEDIPRQEIVASIRAVTPLDEHTRLLHLQAPRSNRLRFLAGQSASLGAATAAGDVQGAYAIASCPCDDRNLHFHIGRDESDAFSVALFSGDVRPGERVTLVGPEGRFVLRGDPGKPLVFAACDLGFAPVKSLVEYALSADVAQSYSIGWLATRPGGHYLANQCRAWAEALDGFAWLPLTNADAAAGASELVAALGATTDLSRAEVYVAGPDAFVQAAEFEFRSAGVAPDTLVTLAI